MKFIHAADLHLDSPLLGLFGQNAELAAALQRAGRQALVNLVDLALREEVDLVVLAGDVFDGDWKDFHTGLFFVGQMKRLVDADIPVVAIAGNHDAAGKMTKSLPLPPNFRLLSPDRPESVAFDNLGVCVHGQSFAKPAVLENLAAAYPSAAPGAFNIGLLHTALDGAVGHEPYAPCKLDDLRAKGYDYWALGHIHQRGELCAAPFVVYPGNLQGRHIRETGAKGCVVVTTSSRGVETTFHSLEVVRWSHLEVPADGDSLIELLDAATDAAHAARREADRPIALRLTFVGRTPLHERLAADLPKLTFEFRAKLANTDAFVESVRTRTARPTKESAALDGALAELLQMSNDAAGDGDLRARLGNELEDLAKKLAIAGAPGDAFDPQNPAWLDEVLAEALPLLARKLVELDPA